MCVYVKVYACVCESIILCVHVTVYYVCVCECVCM